MSVYLWKLLVLLVDFILELVNAVGAGKKTVPFFWFYFKFEALTYYSIFNFLLIIVFRECLVY
jgi:hypothetical protein